MTENNNDEAIDDLFKRLEKAIGMPLSDLFNNMNPQASDRELMDDFLTKTFNQKKKKVAKDFTQIEVAAAMLLSGYLIDPRLKEISSFSLLTSLSESKGIEAFASDMRANGMEVSFDQVAEAIDTVMSYVVEFGLASVQQGLMTADVDCAPPKARNRHFEDLGIEDPFKEN